MSKPDPARCHVCLVDEDGDPLVIRARLDSESRDHPITEAAAWLLLRQLVAALDRRRGAARRLGARQDASP